MIDGAGGIFIHNDTKLNLDVILQSMSCDYGRETLNIGCTVVECIKSWWGDRREINLNKNIYFAEKFKECVAIRSK